MNLIKEKMEVIGTTEGPLHNLPQDLLKGLCFNCDHRKSCEWKNNRKIYCEHFE